jgi:hypothetical protein
MEITIEIHRALGKSTHGQVWGLLEKTDRKPDDDYLMQHAAHASLYHWLQAGTGVHAQRGEWLVAHVYTVLGLGETALRHAQRCVDLTGWHKTEMLDFDLAYAYEGLARAYALLGDRQESTKYKAKARQLGDQIADPEDKGIFDADFSAGDWYGIS